MEAFFAIASFGIVGLLFAGIFWWNRYTQTQERIAFAELAPLYGLTLVGTDRLEGPFGRGTLAVTLATERRGSGKQRRTVRVTRYHVTPPAPLRMGLHLSSQSAFFGDIAEALGLASDIRVGRDDVDGALRISGADPEHAARIFRQDDVAMAAIQAAPLNRFVARDDHAFAQHDGWVTSPERFEQFARPLGLLVDALTAARAHTRAAWEQTLDAGWSRLAEARGFTYEPAQSSLVRMTPSGTVLTASVEPAAGKLVTVARVRVARGLGHGLRLYRTGGMETLGALFGAQDLRIGVPAIDDAFTIKAVRPSEATALLAGLGVELETLARTFSELQLDDQGLEAKHPELLADPGRLGPALDALVRIGHALGGEALHEPAAFR